MRKRELDKLLTPQEKEMGFVLVETPSGIYLHHLVDGFLKRWSDQIDKEELAEIIRLHVEQP